MASEPKPQAIEPESVDGMLVELLAVLGMPLPRTRLVEWCKAANLRLSSRDLRDSIQRLTERGMVAVTPHEGAFVRDPHLHALLDAAHRAKRLQRLMAIIRRAEPIRERYAWQPSSRAMSRELAWALHVGLHEDAAHEYERWESGPAGPAAREMALLEAWGL
ncbi:MAG TPA: hypothetical protein VJR89_39625, partial [Polyangiales bacterium]|nr:hypothetical protein [Polyangiales bacterium]